MTGIGAPRRATLALLLVILTSAACQPTLIESTPATTAAATPTATQKAVPRPQPPVVGMNLRGVGIQVWHPWFGPEAGLINSQVAEFNQKNEWGITVRTKGHTGYTELYNDVTEALPGNEAPQLAVAMPEHALAWDTEGYVVDLSAYLADPGYGFSTDELTDFPTVFLDQELLEGRRLGLPAQRSANFLVYDRTWAAELGFSDPPRNPQEFREQACAAHAALNRDDDVANDVRGGWLMRTDAMTFLSWLSTFGGGVLDGAGYRFLSPRNLEATVFLKQLYDDGCSWLAPAGENPAAAFATRQALFGMAPLEEFSELGRAMASAQNTDHWSLLGFPGATRAASWFTGHPS